MSNLPLYTLQLLSQKLKSVSELDWPKRPPRGWIHAIRTSLKMPADVLGDRAGVSQQRISAIEREESHDTLTLQTLRRIADGLDCELVYALIPKKGDLKGILRKQAFAKATEIMSVVDQSMRLEGQGVKRLEDNIKDLAEEMIENPKTSLWRSAHD